MTKADIYGTVKSPRIYIIAWFNLYCLILLITGCLFIFGCVPEDNSQKLNSSQPQIIHQTTLSEIRQVQESIFSQKDISNMRLWDEVTLERYTSLLKVPGGFVLFRTLENNAITSCFISQ